MVSNSPILLLNPGHSRKRWWLFILLGGIGVAVVGVGIWLLSPSANQSGCLVGPTDKVYTAAPAVSHQYEGEKIAYLARQSGKYVPLEESKVYEFEGHSYGIKFEFDQPYLSPAVGSTLSGRVILTRDGQRITSLPQDSRSGRPTLGFSNARLAVFGLSNLANQSKSGEFQGLAAQTAVSPNPVTHLVSPQATTTGALDLSRGLAEFTFYYFGGRVSPYLDFKVADELGNYASVSSNQIVCFQDQSNLHIDQPALDRQTKADFYFDVRLSPAQISGGHGQQIKIEVVAKTSRSNNINQNPLQRVKLSAYPLVAGKSIPGKFLVSWEDGSEIAKTNIKQLLTSDRYGGYAEFDLIEGKGVAYFDYNGEINLLNPRLSFLVQPANFDISNIPEIAADQPYRVKQKIAIPDKPANIVETQDEGTWNEKQVTLVPKFLYQTWRTDDTLPNKVYTVASVSMTGAGLYTAKSGGIFGWWLPLQLAKGLLAVGLIWWMRRRQRQ